MAVRRWPGSGRLATCFFAREVPSCAAAMATSPGRPLSPFSTARPFHLPREMAFQEASPVAGCDWLTLDLLLSTVPLHNHFLMAIVSNAHNSSTTPAPGPGQAKRHRPDDVTPYGAKRRVLSWVLGTSRREREKLKVRDAYEESIEKTMKDVERRRDERRRTGAGWVGGSELTRERAVLGPSSSVNVEDESRSPLPTGTSLLLEEDSRPSPAHIGAAS